ncbi:MAG: helix-turn-helix domain-containing protein [Chlamydiota bacterium]
MADNLKAIGEAFKTRRHEMNLSLKEVENATSIRMGYLQAIEEGKIQEVITYVYAQGFLKQYAIFLGLDQDEEIQKTIAAFGDASKEQANTDYDYNIGDLEVRGSPTRNVKWLPNIAWIGASVLIVIVAWYLAKLFEVL